ncbi:MAG TPA: hypothetical protein PLD20_24050 [Blastocatellia bacterium]|nr:hypothetical protein [Blastocatellia bacterium]HMV82255.1 hypothetical protein [Blastocatellia bacterium]HMX27357.1 hypothetical protein [Blastocatellia bacterium]HMY70905.1 hypothetical protein [Blastocatellia bacterium]HMZ21027.1 hypothetical protein [Blastocatellia bacterium]
MSIAEVSLFRRNFNLRAPSVIAYESIETAPNTPVRIEMENVTGENAESVERTNKEIFLPACCRLPRRS